MKKKLMMLVSIITLAMMLVACGSEEAPAVPTTTTAPTSTPTPEPTSTPTPEPTATSTPTPTPTPEPTSTPTPAPTSTPTPEPTATPVPSVEDSYAKGVTTDIGFESEWMNLRFTAQSGVYMYTQAELDELMAQSAELMYGDSAQTMLNYVELTTVTEMMAKYMNGANVIVQVERLPVLYTELTEQEYIGIVIENVRNSAVSPEVVTGENYYIADIGGEEYIGLSAALDYGTGEPYYQEYLARKKENRIIFITATYTEGTVENAENLLSSFGSFDSEPIYLPEPTETPTVADEVFRAGVVTEVGYENEWLNLRITLPEGVTLVDESVHEEIALEMAWEYGVPIVQIMVEEAVEGEDTPETHIEMMKEAFTLLGQYQGMTYSFDEELYLVEIGGQEYLDLFMEVDTDDDVKVYQDYCVRVQDGYTVVIVFSYADGFDEELQEALDAFSTY